MPTAPRIIAFKLLKQMLPSQFEEVILFYDAPFAHISQKESLAEKAIRLLRFAEAKETSDLPELFAVIEGVAPHLGKNAIQATQADIQRTNIRNKLAQARQTQDIAPAKRPIDKSLLNNYNLDTLLKQFDDTLESSLGDSHDISGIFSFYLNFNMEHGLEVLDNYVLERIRKAFQDKVNPEDEVNREISKRCVDIAPMNATDPLAAVCNQLALERLSELYEGDACTDVLLVVRNTDVPTMNFFSLAKQFQTVFEAELQPCVDRTQRCCIIFWANAHTQPAEETWQCENVLDVPSEFNLPHLRRWLKKELKDDQLFERLSRKINDFGGDIRHTYRALREGI